MRVQEYSNVQEKKGKVHGKTAQNQSVTRENVEKEKSLEWKKAG